MMIPVVVESVRINLANGQRVVILKDSKIDRYLLIWVEGKTKKCTVTSD